MALVLSTAACGGDDSSDPYAPTTGTRVPPASPTTDVGLQLVVDTDLAADDLVALSYLAANPRVQLLAVTVTGTGEVRCPRGADIARGLLASMDLADVPAACGRTQPLSGDRVFPGAWRMAADDAWGLVLPAVATPADAPDAVELLTRVITSAAAPVTLLTLGPLTNVAEAIDAHPELVDRLSRIVVMGGALEVPGNVQPEGAPGPLAIEWNLYVDPEAAARVVASGVPLTLVALDATNAVPVTRDVLARLAANDITEASGRVRELFERYPPPFLWDPLAAIAVTDPELVPTDALTVAVLTGGQESGRTVVSPDGSPIDVARPPDADLVLDHLLRTLAGIGADDPLAVATTTPVLGEVTIAFDGTACSYDGPDPIDAGAYRVTLVPGEVPYAVVVGQLLGGATLDETMAWIAEHPDQQPPMVGATAFIGVDMRDPPDSVQFERGSVAIVCVTDAESIVPGIEVSVVG
jgi:inosine-uridine nucleoside N-ribohydrolase